MALYRLLIYVQKRQRGASITKSRFKKAELHKTTSYYCSSIINNILQSPVLFTFTQHALDFITTEEP